MATIKMPTNFLATVLLSLGLVHLVNADSYAVSRTTWGEATATFYGGNDAAGTYAGACGYGNPYNTGYGVQTTALSNALFNNGLTCGACFELQCRRSATAYAQKWCYANASPIYITATNQCPPGSTGGWCNPPNLHFDLAYPAFTRLANEVAGVIPVQYRRVKCNKPGGIKFTIGGNPYWNSVLVFNVAGAGNVVQMSVRIGNYFQTMTRDWGQNWDCYNKLTGQSLTFRVTTGLGTTITFWNVFPSTWWFGLTAQAHYNIW
ncbi:unnamed protein product [Calypogeia fissa]